MTGKDLIEFINNNSLLEENITIEFFCFKNKVKFCGKCEKIVKLENFHKGTSGIVEQSSGYRYICKECFNKQAFHKKYKKRDENGI